MAKNIEPQIWICRGCKTRGEMEYHEGEGIEAPLDRLRTSHDAATPGCGSSKVQITLASLVDPEELGTFTFAQ